MAKKEKGGMEDLISQVEAAELRGVSKAAIADLIRRGRLQTITVAGRPLLRRSDVEKFEPHQGWPKGKTRK
jgi:excisionase family DNA binding protein